MKTNILFSSPYLRFLRVQWNAMLAWGKELGAREVLSLYSLEKFQQKALNVMGNSKKKGGNSVRKYLVHEWPYQTPWVDIYIAVKRSRSPADGLLDVLSFVYAAEALLSPRADTESNQGGLAGW